MNRVLFVYGPLYHGGIETQMIRLANAMVGEGFKVAACVGEGELATHFDRNVDLLRWRERKEAVSLASGWLRGSPEATLMISFDPISASLGLAIESRNPTSSIIHTCGIYHTHTFFMKGERPDRILLNRLVASAIGFDRLFFMNSECRESHAQRWRVDLDDSPIIPLSIEQEPASWHPRSSPEVRVVSVGRLVQFKGYNLAAAEIARECQLKGLDVRWDIYGHGPLEDSVRQSIDAAGMADRVRLLGTLPYSDFRNTVEGYDLFVGMGTAAMEASMIGVPTLVATSGEVRRTFGYMNELPFGNVGEPQGHTPPYDLGDVIQAFSALDEDERQKIGLRCHAAMNGYTSSSLIKALGQMAASAARGPSFTRKRLTSALYEAAVDSAAARGARKLKSAFHSGPSKAQKTRL